MAIEQLSSNGAGNDGNGKEEITKDDILAELDKDDEGSSGKEEKEEKEELEEKEEKDEEEIELEEDEEKEKEEEELNLDDVKVGPFRKAEIEKDFPGVLKKYPYLETAYFRDRAFTEVFASPAEAKEAYETIEEFGKMEQELFQGNTADLLGRVKEEDPKAFARMTDNYMESLRRVDQDAHNHVVSGIVKNLIGLLAKEGRRTQNDELRKTALAINQFVFESDEYEPHKPLSEAKDNSVDEERQQFLQERFETVQEELQGSVDGILETTIKNNIDPRGSLTEYVKKNAIRDAMEEVRGQLEKDTKFRSQLDKLWERAIAAKFNRESVKAIKDAYLSKAKTVLKPAITKAKNEALKGSGKRVRDDGDSDTRNTEREYHKGNRRGSTTSDKGGQKKADTFKGSTLDFLNAD